MEFIFDTNGAAPEDDGPGNTRPVTEASWCTAAKHDSWGWGTSSRWNEQR